MTWWLRVLTALPEDPGLVPGPHIWLTAIYNCSFKGFAIFWLCGCCMHVALRYTSRQATCAHVIKINKSLKYSRLTHVIQVLGRLQQVSLDFIQRPCYQNK